MTVKKLSVADSSATFSWTPQVGQRVSITDSTQILFPRSIRLDSTAIIISKPGYAVGILVSDLMAVVGAVEPNLTWPPIVTTQPLSKSIEYAQSTTFPIVISSELSATYQWQVSTNGGLSYSNLSNAGVYTGVTTATLSISTVTGLHTYRYRCAVTNSNGVTLTSQAILTVIPHISSQPSNSSVTHPASTSFAVTAVGTSTLTYQWYISHDAGITWSVLSNGGVYTGATTATLSISDSTGLDGSRYRVVITDGNIQTNTSSSALLTVA